MRIFTGYENPASTYHAQWKLIVAALKESARRASEFGVTLGVQNHHDIGVGYESFNDLIRAVDEPNCKAMFDAWAPALHGVRPCRGRAQAGTIDGTDHGRELSASSPLPLQSRARELLRADCPMFRRFPSKKGLLTTLSS